MNGRAERPEASQYRGGRIPVFPFGSETAYHQGEKFASPDSLVANFWGRTKHLLVSLDYHETLSTPGERTIPPINLRAVKTQTRRLREILGDSVDVVINTAGIIPRLETETDLPIITRSGLDYRATSTSELTSLNTKPLEAFGEAKDAIQARLTERDMQLVTVSEDYVFIPLGGVSEDVTTSLALIEDVVPEEHAEKLRVLIDHKREKIAIYPRVYKLDGNDAYLRAHGIDPSDATNIHIGDDPSDIPPVDSVFGARYFVAPNNASQYVQSHASYTASTEAPEVVQTVVSDLADAIGTRVLHESTAVLRSGSPDDEAYRDAVENVKRWFTIAARRSTAKFEVAPTTNLVFEELQDIFGRPLTAEESAVFISSIFDTTKDIEKQINTLAGVDSDIIARKYDAEAFDDHPLAKSDTRHAGMQIIALRGDEVKPVYFDQTRPSKENETKSLELTADTTVQLANSLTDFFGDRIHNVVLLSLFRGGIYPAIGLQQVIGTKTGIEVPHMAVIPQRLKEPRTIIVDGVDATLKFAISGEELSYVLDQHPRAALVFVDGWVGSGEVINNLRQNLAWYKQEGGVQNDVYFATLVDALGVSDFVGTPRDEMLGWNNWDHNDKTHAFFHRKAPSPNTQLVSVNPDVESYTIAEQRLGIWLEHIDAAIARGGESNKIEQAPFPLTPQEYLQKCLEVLGYSADDVDMSRVKFGINEAFIRLHNDLERVWMHVVVHTDYLHTAEMQKVLESAKHINANIYHTDQLPCLAVVSMDPIENPEVLASEFLVTETPSNLNVGELQTQGWTIDVMDTRGHGGRLYSIEMPNSTSGSRYVLKASSDRESFAQECGALQVLTHAYDTQQPPFAPPFPTLAAFDTTESSILMESLEGEQLKVFYGSDPQVAIEVGLAMLKGIQFINENGIAHLDIHGENGLYNHRIKRFTFLDFGYSGNGGSIDAIEQVGLRSNKPRIYKAPELTTEIEVNGELADRYGIASQLCSLFWGRDVVDQAGFKDNSVDTEKLKMLLDQRPLPIPYLAEAIITNFSNDPSQRTVSYADFERILSIHAS